MVLKSGGIPPTMIQRSEMGQILRFVGGHWNRMSGDPGNKAMRGLPDRFWMNSLGGKAGGGYWVTTLMYTEDGQLADAFRDVLMKWQSRGSEGAKAPDLIQIDGRK